MKRDIEWQKKEIERLDTMEQAEVGMFGWTT